MPITIDLPQLPPSVNGLFLNMRGKGRVKAPKYREWIELCSYCIPSQFNRETITGPVKVEISLVRPDKRRRDVSNLIKAPEDLLVSSGVLRDDMQVVDVRAYWATEPQVSPCRITIHEKEVE